MSRYPIDETIQLFRSFNSGGALIRISEEQQIAFYDIWLHYLPDVSDLNNGKAAVKKYEEDEAQTRIPEIKEILKQMAPRTAQSAETPVILVWRLQLRFASGLERTGTSRPPGGFLPNWKYPDKSSTKVLRIVSATSIRTFC